MKIERKDISIRFGELIRGDCFRYGEDYYIKTESYTNMSSGMQGNSIDLETGEGCHFVFDEIVEKVKAKVVEE